MNAGCSARSQSEGSGRNGILSSLHSASRLRLSGSTLSSLSTPLQSRQRCIMCHPEGGLCLKAHRGLTTVTVQHRDYNPASALWNCGFKQTRCACPPVHVPWKRYLDRASFKQLSSLGVFVSVTWLRRNRHWLSGITAREKQGAKIGQRLPPPPSRCCATLGKPLPNPGHASAIGGM